ncbi:hypothetical protein ACH5AO_26900 [Streptomyces sp. NPDC018964]|uniref:hypothetical protein n=1 Tax=Streptomyces sp. NPDC018964 TaxID=3365058 RepID=UPI0037B265C6
MLSPAAYARPGVRPAPDGLAVNAGPEPLGVTAPTTGPSAKSRARGTLSSAPAVTEPMRPG